VLGLPRRLALDPADLARRFHALSRRLHPDYFRLRPAEEQAVSLDNAAAVNAAYRALRDAVGRVEALLALEGVAFGGGKPPADLFEELLEIQALREALGASGEGESTARRARLEAIRDELADRRRQGEAELGALLPRWDEADPPGRAVLLGRMRDILATRAYLGTVLRDLEATLAAGGPAAMAGEIERGRAR
jgi:molecular chaperone HscB